MLTVLDENIVKSLRTLGLSQKESGVYLACLELGAAPVQDIAKKAVMKRATVYNYLEVLKEKGFLSELKRAGRRIFIAEKPETLEIILKKKRLDLQSQGLELDTLENNLSQTVRQLSDFYAQTGAQKRPEVCVYEGREGLKRVYADVIQTGGEFLNISAWHLALNVLPESFHREFIADRVKYDVFNRVIIVRSPEAEELKRHDAEENREIRFFQKNPVNFDMEIYIYGHKTAFLSYKDSIMSIIIDHAVISLAMKAMFDVMWEKSAKK